MSPRQLSILLILLTPLLARAQLGMGPDFGGLAGAPRTAVVAAAEDPGTSVLRFDVDGGISSVVGDGRFILHGKLRMKPTDVAAHDLSLVDGIDQFWRYTSVDPPNLFGDNTEQRFASVLLLPDRSGTAWNEATRPMRTLGTTTHNRYYPKRTLHTNKHFYVLGNPAGRFRLVRGDDGGLSRIENRLTSRWDSGGWDVWAGYEPRLDANRARAKWASAARLGLYGPGARSGTYSWFPSPFRGMAKALTLLRDSPYLGGSLLRTTSGTRRYDVRLNDFQTRFKELLITLEPNAEELWYEVPTPTMRYTRSVRDGKLRLSGVASGNWKGGWGILSKSGTLRLERELEVIVATGRIIKDEVTFTVRAGGLLRCDLEVGYSPEEAPRTD